MKSTFLYIAIFATAFSARTQLQADFTTDKDGGCSPLAVSFTNTTTGASSSATYHWSFDNGNESVLKNAGAIFYIERTYSITLRVTDGAQSSTKTKQVIVYKKPTVDFVISPASGCLPLQTTLTSSSSPGDGTLAAYHWDFGDGITQQSPNPSITHQYNFLQSATISLTAINSHGCSNTMVKPNAVTIHPPVQVAFHANTTIACQAPATIQFTNNSTGPGTLSYLWDFGDNETSTAASPSHTYQQRGTYTVKLTVTSNEGCSATVTRTSYINVANFTTSFQEPALVCSNGSVTFNNTSTPAPIQSNWLFDGANSYTTFGNNPVAYAFATTGPHTVQLTNTFGPCQETITRTVDVKEKPKLDGFLLNITSLCGSPVQVNFQDTTQAAVSWAWNFNWPFNTPGHSSDLQSPSHTYNSDGAYQASLTVTNAAGCSASVVKPVGISKPLVGIFLEDGYTNTACDNLTTKFKTRSTETIISYQWDFGDGSAFSSDPQPTHTYTQPGTYIVSLTYTTINGCTGTVYYNSIFIRQKPVADFVVQPTVCGNTPLFFTATTTGFATTHIWNFGDNTGNQAIIPSMHQYQAEGVYDVTLIAHNGMCNDTITKPAIIRVLPPFPKIGPITNTCEGTRGLVTFGDLSRQVESWHWSFGDNGSTSYTAAQSTVQHEYNATLTYKVVLTTTNGACTVKDSTVAPVLMKQHPVLTANASTICFGSPVNVVVSALERPPFATTSPFYEIPYNYFGFWQPDGTAFPGNVSNGPIRQFPWTASLSNFPYGQTQVRTISQSTYFGCYDTTNFITVDVKGPTAAINYISGNICFKEPLLFQDVSTARNNIAIVRCDWSFGDNTSSLTTAPGATVSHRYANPGAYNVTLKVTDADGCTSTKILAVRAKGPKAIFTPSGTNVPLNTTVHFTNSSSTFDAPGVTWQWDFGGIGASNLVQPSFTFTTPGSYVVSLVTSNPVIACVDTAKQTIIVNNFNPGFGMATTLIGEEGKCPPVLARFQNTSTNWTRLTWDFGDGFILENQNAPSHIYHTPGTYIVTLTVRGFNGLNSVQHDTVRVSQPNATIQADDIDGCIGHQLTLNAPTHNNAVSYLWDFGNGHIRNTTDSFSVHQYLSPGSFNASLIAKDNNGCAVRVPLASPVIIYPDPVITMNPAAPVVCKAVPVQLQANGATSYAWSPSTGLNNTIIASPVATPAATTTYTVNGTDDRGCKGTGTITVTVPQPFAMQVRNSVGVCRGDSVQLTASGAQRYQWINTITGLSNTQIANPIASPLATTAYTVVGFDSHQCYSDTERVTVIVHPLPLVNAGADRQVIYGSPNQLTTTNSSDVTRWNWSPAEFLNCSSCASPISKPYNDMQYVVTAYTSNNCMSSDTIKLAVACGEGNIYIPNAFTPDNDGKNDGFTINGYGVRNIKSMRIYNRWGEIVFERRNFYPNDASAAWRGKYKGLDAPAGAYVYLAEMECANGEVFLRKGTVTLIR